MSELTNLLDLPQNPIGSDLPSVFDFETSHIAYQHDILNTIEKFDYEKDGLLEVICSGSVGSAKSAIAAYMGLRHVLQFPGATLLLGRKSLPDIKDTIFKDIVEMLECEQLQQGKHYWVNENIGRIRFKNGSTILSRSWSDRKYKKLGSLKLSAAIIEELAENDEEDSRAYDFVTMRVGRLPHVPHKWIMGLTNPDEPEHWVNRRLVSNPTPKRKVFITSLRDNPFLPKTYENDLREGLDPIMAERMIEGKWVSLIGKNIYRQYRKDIHYRETDFTPLPGLPIWLSFDFNVAVGKPMSAVAAQYIDDHFHFFREFVVEGVDTGLMMEEIAATGFLDTKNQFIITGDATGGAKSSKYYGSDYDIISKAMSNYQNGVRWKLDVGKINPPIKTRHNTFNAYLLNANGNSRITVYNCNKLDEGLRLTKLKKGANYVEDDSKDFQHITTAAGYLVCKAKIRDEPQMINLPRWGRRI